MGVNWKILRNLAYILAWTYIDSQWRTFAQKGVGVFSISTPSPSRLEFRLGGKPEEYIRWSILIWRKSCCWTYEQKSLLEVQQLNSNLSIIKGFNWFCRTFDLILAGFVLKRWLVFPHIPLEVHNTSSVSFNDFNSSCSNDWHANFFFLPFAICYFFVLFFRIIFKIERCPWYIWTTINNMHVCFLK